MEILLYHVRWLDTTTGVQSSDTATGVCLCERFASDFQSEVEYEKQTNKICFFNFGKDLGYFVILRYKLCDFIKIHDDYVNDPMKGDFQKTLLLFQIIGLVAQSVEHSPANQEVPGSIPVSANSAYE